MVIQPPYQDLLFVNKMPNLLPSQRMLMELTTKRNPLLLWIYGKTVFDIVGAAILILAIMFSTNFSEQRKLDFECTLNSLATFLYVLMAVLFLVDAKQVFVVILRAAKRIPDHRAIQHYDIYRSTKNIIIVSTLFALGLSLIIPVNAMLSIKTPHNLIDSTVFLPLFLIGDFWLWLDFFSICKASHEYCSFERHVLDLVGANAIKNCNCDKNAVMITGNPIKLPLIGDIKTENEVKVDVTEEDAKKHETEEENANVEITKGKVNGVGCTTIPNKNVKLGFPAFPTKKV